MKQRTLSALVMAVVMIPILILGNTYQIFNLLCLLLSVLAAIEFRRMFQKKHHLPFWIDLLVVVLSAGMGVVLYLELSGMFDALFIIYLIVLLFFFFLLWVFVKDFKSMDFGNALLSVFYTSIGFAAVALLRDQGIYVLVYLLLVSFITDTFAYLFGVKFGKHKLAPFISPKKTVEGAVAGLLFGGILATVFAVLLNVFDFHFIWILLLSFGLSILSQIGDLVASRFKREADIKDYSNLFPGHGGVLDRFDSLIFSATYLMIILFMIELF